MEPTTPSIADVLAPTEEPERSITDQDAAACRSALGTFPECPLCGGGLTPEHAHFKCRACGWRDSCCD